MNYRHRGGSTTVELKGTDRMPEITGRAKVDGKAGRLAINAEVQKHALLRNHWVDNI